MAALALLPLLCGIALLWRALSKPREASWRMGLALSLGPPLGLALSSLAYFLLRLVLGLSDSAYTAADTLFFLILLAVLLFTGMREEGRGFSFRLAASGGDARPKHLLFVFGLALLLACLTTTAVTLLQPHGVRDAWSIWNLQARFFHMGGPDAWTEIFRIRSAQPDYPLMVPGSVARLWLFTGGPNLAAPISVAMLFTASTVALLCVATVALKGRIIGLTAGAVLLAHPVFFQRGASQCADIPLAFFILATVVLFAMAENAHRGAQGLILISGTVAAFALWTKNEGLIFFPAAFMGRLYLSCATGSGARRWRDVGLFVLGSMAPLLAVLIHKGWYAPPNSYGPALVPSYIVSCFLDPSRYVTIVGALWDRLAHPNLIPGIIACFLPFVFGFSPQREQRRSGVVALGLVLTMGVAYFFIYVITPDFFDLAWTVQVSASRLLLQIWPTLLFGVAMLVRTPERGLNQSSA
ncbi:MAG: hypothetical protein CME06_01825 [Gemmatimonadetes bacterium]|nr:hypothetical protein [Gemmatimonadota bacterium]